MKFNIFKSKQKPSPFIKIAEYDFMDTQVSQDYNNGKFTPYYFYTNNPWVFRCVDLRAVSLAGVPCYVSKVDKPDVAIEDDKDINAWLKRPNRKQTMQRFIRKMSMQLDLWGKIYIEWATEGSFTNGNGTAETILLAPSRVREKYNKDGSTTFTYSVNSRDKIIPAEKIIQGQYDDPESDVSGVSPLRSVIDDLTTDLFAVEHNKAFLKNGARGDKALIFDEIGEEEIERVRVQFEKKHSGPKNSGRAIIVSGNPEIKDLSTAPKDMDFLQQREWTRSALFAAMGVPSVMAGILDQATYANAKEQRQIFWEDTMSFRMENIADIMTQAVQTLFADNTLLFRFDKSQIAALRENENERVDRNTKLISTGQRTIDETRVEDGYDPYPGEMGKKPLIPAGNVLLEDLTAPLPPQIDVSADIMPEVPNNAAN